MGPLFGKLYWVIPLILFAAQALMTFSSGQLRLEEVTAAFREVFWFANREIYEPGNSNLGWYGTLAALYSIFGFDVYTGKIYRLLLQLVSLFCLAALLRRFLGEKWAVVPLLTIGLSPTMLFWNTLEAPYGIDLQFLPIVLFLLLRSPLRVLPRVFHPKKPTRGPFLGVPLPVSPASGSRHPLLNSVLYFSAWFMAMFASLTYPTFVFYLPALVILYFFHLGGISLDFGHSAELSRSPRDKQAYPRGVLLSLAAFLAPLAFIVLGLKGNPGRVFIAGSGPALNETSFAHGVVAPFTNLFGSATSYYLEIRETEMSLVFPVLAFLFVGLASFLIFKKVKSARLPIILCFLVAFVNIIVVALSIDGGLPGGRRNTPFLASFYGLFVISWYYLSNLTNWSNLTKLVARGALALLLVHHALVFPTNLAHIQEKSPFQANIWFGDDPRSSVAKFVDQIRQKDLYLNCEESYPGNPGCQYGPIFSAIQGACLWGVAGGTPLLCHKMYGFFPSVGYEELNMTTINAWQDYGFEY